MTKIPLLPPFAKGGLRVIKNGLFRSSYRCKWWIAVVFSCRDHLEIAKDGQWIVRAFNHSSTRDSIDRLMVFPSD